MMMPFEVWYALLIFALAILAILIGTLTSRSFWEIVKRRKKCKHCYGAGYVEHVGEGIYEKCEHCN